MKTTKNDDNFISNISDTLGKKFTGAKSKYDQATNTFFDSLDDMTLDQAIEKYTQYQKMLWIIPTLVWLFEIILFFAPFQTLDHQVLTLIIEIALMCNLVGVNNVNWFLVNLITRLPNLHMEERLDEIQKLMQKRDWQRAVNLGAVFNTISILTLIPYYEFLRNNPDLQGWTVAMTDKVNGNEFLLKLLLVAIPLFVTYNLYQVEKQTSQQYREEIANGISNKEYQNARIKNMLSAKNHQERKKRKHLPEIIIGQSVETGADVVQSVVTRRQNSIYFGAVGAGKTSTIFIPQIKQDIESLLCWIRDFPKISKMPGFMQKKGNIATEYLNGLAVIDPTNDLVSDIYTLAKNKGVPDAEIIWFDPSNPRTAGINMMRGPADKVAEDFTKVIVAVQAGAETFFKEAGRNYLKNHIFLLKITSALDSKIPTVDDLKDLVDSPYVKRDRMKMLDAYLKILNGKLDESKAEYEADPDNDDKKTKYKEIHDKYKIAYGTSIWFANNVLPNRKGNTVVKRTEPEFQALDDKDPDKWEYEDQQAEFIRGLSNTLDDISKNIGLRRVLFRDAGEFNFDDAMLRGKILLFNTDKEHVGADLASVLGQLYIGALEASSLRRVNNAVPLFPIYMDEFADYLDEGFPVFASQARKFSVPLLIATQSISQLSFKYGPDYFKQLLDVMLTVGTFGSMGPDSAKFFENLFGTKKVPVRSSNEQQVGLLKGMDDNRRMITTKMELVPNATADYLMGMDKFTLAVRTPNPSGFRGASLFNTVRTKYINVGDVVNDVDNFHLNDPADGDAFDTLMRFKGIDNPDFDDIDRKIRQDYLDGKVDYEFTSTGAKVIYKDIQPKHNTADIINSKINVTPESKQKVNTADSDTTIKHGDISKPAKLKITAGDSSNTQDEFNGLFGNGVINHSTDTSTNSKVKNTVDALLGEDESDSNSTSLLNSEENKSNEPLLTPFSSQPNSKNSDKEAEANISQLFDLNPPSVNKAVFKDTNKLNVEAERSVKKSNDPFNHDEQLKQVVSPEGKHGGNNRTNRKITIEDMSPNLPNSNKIDAPVETTPIKEKDEDPLLRIDSRTGKLIEDNKDREKMAKRFEQMNKAQNVDTAITALTKEAQAKIYELTKQEYLSNKDKLAKLHELKENYSTQISTITTIGLPIELTQSFDNAENEIRQTQSQRIVFDGNNKNLGNLQDTEGLLDDIKKLMNEQEDPDIEVDLNQNKIIREATREDDFGTIDPFTQGIKRDEYGN